MGRTSFALKNIFFSLISSVFSVGLTLINRKVMLNVLGAELLGYDSLFADLFAVLSLAELGAGTVIAYRLFDSVARFDVIETNKLISMYKYLYRIIGILIAIVGLVLFFFINRIVTKSSEPIEFTQKIYLIQLFSTVASYFLSYRQMLFVAHQKQYVITKFDMCLSFLSQIMKIMIIIFLKSYIIYLIVSVSKPVVLNIIMFFKTKKYYPKYKEYKVKFKDFSERNVFKDMYNFMGQKIASSVYYNTDNLLISMFLGVSMVGLYSNYYTIKNQVFNLTTTLFNPIQSSVGNFINDPKKNKIDGKKLFDLFDLIGFILAFVLSNSLYNLFQPFIELWYGKEYILSNWVVILISANCYIETMRELPYYFRSAFGDYQVDKKFVFVGALINIAISIALTKYFDLGINGILIGTVVGMFFLWYGVIYFLFRVYFEVKMASYLFKQLKFVIITVVGIFFTSKICSLFDFGFLNLFVRAIIIFIFSSVFLLIMVYRTEEFKLLKYKLTEHFRHN